MSIKFLYWNIHKKSNNFIFEIKKIINNVDILLLIESNIDDNLIEKELGLCKIDYKTNFKETDYTPKFYTRYKNNEFEFIGATSSKRLIFTSLKLSNSDEILIGGIHFPSKLSYSDLRQLEIARNYVQEIEEFENLKNNKKTLLFGDFNMNPFEIGMTEYSAFNATLSEFEAKKISKKSHFKDYYYFYNPMWSFLGDRNYLTGEKKTPGTYYFPKSSPYWNIFDKVIMRPDVIDYFDFSSIKIIDNLGTDKLLNDNFGIRDAYSDHLPLSFKINL